MFGIFRGALVLARTAINKIGNFFTKNPVKSGVGIGAGVGIEQGIDNITDDSSTGIPFFKIGVILAVIYYIKSK